jgi:hypothetical protein
MVGLFYSKVTGIAMNSITFLWTLLVILAISSWTRSVHGSVSTYTAEESFRRTELREKTKLHGGNVGHEVQNPQKGIEIDDILNEDDYLLWPFPPIHDLYIIYNRYYLKRFFENPILKDRLVIALFTVDIEMDSYVPLYLGYLSHIFETLYPNKVTFVIYEPRDCDYLHCAIFFLSQLPERSIFIAFQHGPSAIAIDTLHELYKFRIYPNIIFHINHEQPWVTNASENSLDYTFATIQDFQIVYEQFPLVFRNYYYQPLLSSSVYLPINPPYDRFILHNSSSATWNYYQSLPGSQRQILCSFRGRTDYQSQYYSKNLEDLSESDQDRIQLIALHRANRLGNCQISEKNVLKPGHFSSMVWPYINYMSLIVQSAFVLCPSGNNPETFRLREVCLSCPLSPHRLYPSDRL